jgi:hypothetical protein
MKTFGESHELPKGSLSSREYAKLVRARRSPTRHFKHLVSAPFGEIGKLVPIHSPYGGNRLYEQPIVTNTIRPGKRNKKKRKSIFSFLF